MQKDLSGSDHRWQRRQGKEDPTGERKENCIRFELSSKAELQFEKNYYVKPEREKYDRDSVITWFVQRNMWEELDKKGLPDYLQLKERDILFLK